MKETYRVNLRVEVIPENAVSLSSRTPVSWERALLEAGDLASAVRRHCDGWEMVLIDWDTVDVCSHCGYEWETSFDGPEGPCCCEAAAEEWERDNPGSCTGRE